MFKIHNFLFSKLHKAALVGLFFFVFFSVHAQNSMVGDGFGGRGWYKPTNYCAGSYGAYAICGSNNQLYAWGSNRAGGNGKDSTSLGTITPIAVTNMTNVKYASRGYMGGAIKKDSTGWVWGQPDYNPSITQYTIPPVQVITNAKHVTAGMSNIAFVKNDGTVWTVGVNGSSSTFWSAFGIGSITPYYTMVPYKMNNITNAVRVSTGGGSPWIPRLNILTSDGKVYSTGNLSGMGFSGGSLPVTTPTLIPGVSNGIDIQSHTKAVYVLTSGGEVYVQGNSPTLGLGATTSVNVFTKVTFPVGASSIIAISACDDGDHVLALDTLGNVYGWGGNGTGLLGIGNNVDQETPILVASGVIDILAGETYSYIVKSNGTLWATGNSNYGGSIWLDLPSQARNVWTQINPTNPTINLCTPSFIPSLCNAGTTAPTLSATTGSNTCPATTANLNTLVTSTTPSGATLVWFTNNTHTGTAYSTPTAATAGTYYAFYYDSTNSCYSPASGAVTVTIAACAGVYSTSPIAKSDTVNQSRTGNAATETSPTGGTGSYVYSDGSTDPACTAPSGATALPASSNLTVASNGSYSYTAPATAGIYYFCVKVCDTATPTPSCSYSTYIITVTNPAAGCNAGTTAPVVH